MNTARLSACSGTMLAVALTLGLAGCSVFDDPSPHDISVEVTGKAGTLVEVILAKQFEAGIDDSGATHVQIYVADTVFHVLPLDTVVSVEIEKRLFVQIATTDDAEVPVEARVYVDGRQVVADARTIAPSEPWRYLYVFNQAISPVVDVVF